MIQVACQTCGVPQTRKRQTVKVFCRACRQRAYRYRLCKGDQPHIFPKPGESTMHAVNCRDCGAEIRRGTHWRYPSCKPCTTKRWRATDMARRHARIEEARRYRILLAVSPYGSYEELLDALKVRNPKTKSFRFDTTMEKRARA